MHMHHMCVWCIWRAEEDIQTSGTGFTAVMSCLMWVLGAEPRLVGRAACTVKH